MSTFHEHTVRTAFCPSHLQMGCNGVYFSLPYTKTAIGVWSLQSLTSMPLELVAHRKEVTAITFGNGYNPTSLCTAAEDYVIVWNVEKARATYDAGHQIRGQIIGQGLGYIQYVSFSPSDMLVAVCIEKDILILDANEERLDTTLDGHTARVTCAEFSPHLVATIVSISDDRTFKIWDIGKGCLLFQSTIISASPFVSLSMDPANEHFAVGTSDGQIRVYDMVEDYRLLHHVDVAKILRRKREADEELRKAAANTGPKKISSQPQWKRTDNDIDVESVDDSYDMGTSSEAGESILGLFFAVRPSRKRPSSNQPKATFLMPDESHIDDLLDVAPTLLVGTPGAILQINAHSYELAKCVDFQDPVPSEQDFDTTEKYIDLSGSFIFSHTPELKQVYCLAGSLFQNFVDVLRIQCATDQSGENQRTISLTNDLSQKLNLEASGVEGNKVGSGKSSADGDAHAQEQTVTVLSSVPLSEHSLLREELVPKTKPSSAGQKGQPGMKTAKKTSSGVHNQSLTFKSKIRSSGYTDVPRLKMHSPQTSSSKSSSLKQSKSVSTGKRTLLKEYPLDAEPPTTIKTKLNVVEKSSPINCIRFSDDGQHLACAMADKSAQLFKMPLTGKGSSYTGHNGCVNCVYWSHDNQWMLTCSDDKTAKIWNKNASDPIITFSTVKDNFAVDKEGPKSVANKKAVFSKEMKQARFYYMDKFVLLSCGGSLYMYKYHLDSSVNDIKRYLTNSRYKLVKDFQLTKAQQISTFSAVNGFYSYIVLCAGSDKSLEAFDMNVGKSVRLTPDAHSRPIHAICQNEGSTFVSHPASAYDLFLTSAVTDGVKLWDLRTNRCVRRFEGHVNRAYTCGLAFSPCAKYFATGAEDRSAYVFDLRGGTYLHKLSGHTDVVSDVAFHPLYPELVTATLDGKLRLYSDR